MKLKASRLFLNGSDMTDFVQSENNVAEWFLNFLKLVTLPLLTPCSRQLQFSNRLLTIVLSQELQHQQLGIYRYVPNP